MYFLFNILKMSIEMTNLLVLELTTLLHFISLHHLICMVSKS